MTFQRSAFLRLTLCLLAPFTATARDAVVAFPSGNTNVITVFDAADLSLVATVPVPARSFAVRQNLDGSKYYLLNRSSQNSIIVLDSRTLEQTNSIDLGAQPSEALVSPDGRYLLAAAGSLRVISTATELEVASVPVGGSATQIVVDETSSRAYVLTSSGTQIHVVDLTTFQLETTLTVSNVSSIQLTTDSARLLAASGDKILQFRTRDFSDATVEFARPNVRMINAILHVMPGSGRVVVQNRGVGAERTSFVADLENGRVEYIGNVGLTELLRIAVVDGDRAYAIDSTAGQLIRIQVRPDGDVDDTPLPFGAEARDIGVSPDGRFLYVSSVSTAELTKVDLLTETVSETVQTPVAVESHEVVFAPSTLPPFLAERRGGDGQFFPPGSILPTPLSVKVVDRNGAPLPNVPVFFAGPPDSGLVFDPEQPSVTNSRGIATAVVTLPPDEDPNGGGESAGIQEEGAVAGQTLDPSGKLETLTVSATVPNLDPVLFTVTIVRDTGFIVISGDRQVALPGDPFPKPIMVLATDSTGQPLPQDTRVTFSADAGAGCSGTDPQTLETVVGSEGLIRLECKGNPFPAGSSLLSLGGQIALSIPQLEPRISPVGIAFSVMGSGVRFDISKQSGDDQTGPTGSVLPAPLRFKIIREIGFGSPSNDIQVEVTQVSGPPVGINPRRIRTNVERNEEVEVTLGPNAGTSVIAIEASTPGLPTLFYNVNATGGQPVSIEKSNDNQVGKILNPLPLPLRVQIRNESGAFVPFPEVTWRVLSGDATLAVTPDQSGSSAVVTFGGTPGTVTVVAAIGSLQTTFTVTSEPPQPASISTFSGQNQTLTTGLLSDPLIVRVNELTNEPAAGAIVTFRGPPSVRLHPINGSPPGNPVQTPTDSDGLAGVRVELLAVNAGLLEEGSRPSQLASTVSITAELGGSLSTSFLLTVVGRTPEFTSDRVVNAANFAVGLTPGGLATIFGNGLMEGVIGTELPGGATSYKGTQIRVGGVPAPLLAFSTANGEQVNFQAPFELTPGQITAIEVENNGSRSTVGNVPVFRAQPGVFEFRPTGTDLVVAAIHLDGRLVTPEDPADHGEIISMFYTGGGPLNANVQTGVLGPIPAPAVALPTIVGIDNQGVPVLFSGYAPGFLGTYQVNFQVPDNAACGLRAISLQVGDAASGNSSIPIRCP